MEMYGTIEVQSDITMQMIEIGEKWKRDAYHKYLLILYALFATSALQTIISLWPWDWKAGMFQVKYTHSV